MTEQEVFHNLDYVLHGLRFNKTVEVKAGHNEYKICEFIKENIHKLERSISLDALLNRIEEIEYINTIKHSSEPMYDVIDHGNDIGMQRSKGDHKEFLRMVLITLKTLEKSIRAKESMANEKKLFSSNLSVDQLAYLYGLLYESGINKAKPKMDLYKFINKFYETPQRKNPSIGSIKNKISGASDSDKEKVKGKLLDMIKLIQQDLHPE